MFRTFASVENISAFANSRFAQSLPYQSRKSLRASLMRLGLYVRSRKSLKVSSTIYVFTSFRFVCLLLRNPIFPLQLAHTRVERTSPTGGFPVDARMRKLQREYGIT